MLGVVGELGSPTQALSGHFGLRLVTPEGREFTGLMVVALINQVGEGDPVMIHRAREWSLPLSIRWMRATSAAR